MNGRILMTGAGGFIGQFVVPLLIERGYEVHTIGRSHAAVASHVTHHCVDLLAHDKVTDILRQVRPTHLLHFAWIATPGVYQQSPENAQWLAASKHLFEQSVITGCQRIIGAGSSFEYQWKETALHESDPLVPSTPYGIAKRDCGLALADLAAKTNVSTAWGRIFFLYGPGEDPRRLVSSVIRSLLLGEEARTTIGTQVRDFLPVQEVAAAFVTLLESDVSGAVNIGSGTPITVAALITRIAERIGRTDLLRLGAIPMPQTEPPMILADVRRLRNDVRFTPSRTLESALKETIEWWRKNLG